MKRAILYIDGEVHMDEDVEDGDRIELIRGDGPREGGSMGYAVVTFNDDGTATVRTDHHKRE